MTHKLAKVQGQQFIKKLHLDCKPYRKAHTPGKQNLTHVQEITCSQMYKHTIHTKISFALIVTIFRTLTARKISYNKLLSPINH